MKPNKNSKKGRSVIENNKANGGQLGGHEGSAEFIDRAAKDTNSVIAKKTISRLLMSIKSGNITKDDLISVLVKNFGSDFISQNASEHEILSKLLNESTLEQRNRIIEELEIDLKYIPMYKARDVKFSKYIISASEIESQTCISTLNPRSQVAISAVDVGPILDTIRRGQDDIAIGFMNKDGIIEIFDGSRRRYACILAKLNLAVYVTKEWLELEDFVEFYDNKESADDSKLKLNPRDRGQYWDKLIKSGKYTKEDISNSTGYTKRTIDSSLELASVRDDLIELSFAPSHLGTANIKSLRAIGERIDSVKLDELKRYKIELLKTEEFNVDNFLRNSAENQNKIAKSKNSKMVELMFSKIKPETGESMSLKPSFTELVNFSDKKLKRKAEFKLEDKGNGKSVVHFRLINLHEDKKIKIMDKITKIIQKELSETPMV